MRGDAEPQLEVEVLVRHLRRSTIWSCSQSPASISFESGGRSYGQVRLGADERQPPVEPSRRSVSTARRPASDAPTTTIDPSRADAADARHPSIEMAPVGHIRTASSIFGRSSSGGSSWRM